MDVRSYNRDAWDRQVEKGDRWTVPVTSDAIAAAREGRWEVVLTPQKPVPRGWFPPLRGLEVLGLASAGGQQGPLLAAAGAKVTVFDNSPAQLAQDRSVAERDGLSLTTVEGDMRDLSRFGEGHFDLIFNPCSNCFVEDVLPMWRECLRVLKPGGVLLTGFCNPVMFTVDPELEAEGVLQIRYDVPYSDVTSLTDEERRRYMEAGEPLTFGHTLEDQIGGQLAAGFVLTGLYEDRNESKLGEKMPLFLATRAVKPTS